MFKSSEMKILSRLTIFAGVIHISLSAVEIKTFDNFLFGDGNFDDDVQNNFNNEDVIAKHKSSSIEDLMELFNLEKRLAQTLKNSSSSFDDNEALKLAIYHYLAAIDYDLTEEISDYVLHPVNSFHLLERTLFIEHWISEIQQKFPLGIDFNKQFLIDDYKRAHHGIADLHEYVAINPKDLSRGIIKHDGMEAVYKSKTPLTSMNMVNIAMEAQNVSYVDGYVNWLTTALTKAKLEPLQHDPLYAEYLAKIEKNIKEGKQLHDQIYNMINDTDIVGSPPSLNRFPYSNNVSAEIIKERQEILKVYDRTYFNLIPDRRSWKLIDLMPRMSFYYKERIRKLCQDNFERPAKQTKHLKCANMHHGNPYHRLGPFKYELLHLDPEIGLYHQLISVQESENVKDLARGKMRSTPYVVDSKNEPFSKSRTSKVMYMNEKLVKEAMAMSNKVEWATRFRLKDEKYGSENYQVMNYGIGGKITPHVDSPGVTLNENTTYESATSECMTVGGERFVTFMYYLSTVEAGGHTVFPQAGVSVKPEIGSALYWFNGGAQNNYDSRILHLGCPVLYGNKWIANKWVKILGQYKNYPCSTTDKYYSIYRHNLSKEFNKS